MGSAAGVGACAAFLIFNRHPAKLFMGDTGSLALGALLAGAAILTGEMLLLLLIGGVFVAERSRLSCKSSTSRVPVDVAYSG